MSAAASYFQPIGSASTRLRFPISGGYLVDQVPKWVEPLEPTRMGTVAKSITGVLALQEVDRAWSPVTIEFKQSNLPAALLNQTLLNLFLTAEQRGGFSYLYLYGVQKKVIFDWESSGGRPVQYALVTPTGEEDPASGPLYEATIYFLWMRP